jgi:hypothetical protein
MSQRWGGIPARTCSTQTVQQHYSGGVAPCRGRVVQDGVGGGDGVRATTATPTGRVCKVNLRTAHPGQGQGGVLQAVQQRGERGVVAHSIRKGGVRTKSQHFSSLRKWQAVG